MFDGCRERGPTQDRHPVSHSLIVSAWQQVTQSTIQNCFVKCGHLKKNQEGSDVTEVDGSDEDDVTQDEDWVRLGTSTTGVDFDAYVSVEQELAMCGNCVEEGQSDGGYDDNEAASEPVPSFTEALHVFESMRVFMYAHDITKRDQVNIVNIERLLFSLKRKGATKQMRINDFLKKM
jgi:hypothetical protein